MDSETPTNLGQRAADIMRNAMGSWSFIMASLALLGIWMVSDGFGLDVFPWVLLNLVLSCIAALQGAVLLISAKRADELIAGLAARDAAVNLEAERRIEELQVSIARIENDKHNEILREIAALKTRV